MFSVLVKELEENNCDISRGDYIGVMIDEVNTIYYTVADDGKWASTSNKFTMYGKKVYYRTITCNYVDMSEFQG